jgi:hypothetical protein
LIRSLLKDRSCIFKRFSLFFKGQAIYLANTLNDSQLVSELQNNISFNQVVQNWLNARKDVMSRFNITCSNDTLDLGQMFPPNGMDWGTWPPNTCVNFANLRNATHAALDLINCQLQSLYSEEADKRHPYQKAFSIAVVLEIDVWGFWLSQVGFNPGQFWKRNTPPPAESQTTQAEVHTSTHPASTHSSTHHTSTHSTHETTTHSSHSTHSTTTTEQSATTTSN